MNWAIHDGGHRMKVLLMVSNYGHCLNDLLYRWRIGALPIEIVGVVSNHMTYQKLVVNHAIPFHNISVTKDNQPKAEASLLKIVADSGAETIVLARDMRVQNGRASCRESVSQYGETSVVRVSLKKK